MSVEISYPKSLVVKCSHCNDGTTAPARVCHHCGLPFCSEAPEIPPAPEGYVNLEFKRISLDQPSRQHAVHCEAHQHGVRSPRRAYIRWGALFLIVGLVWLASNVGRLGWDLQQFAGSATELTWSGLPNVLVAFGAVLIVVGQVLHWIYFTSAARKQRPPFPVFPSWEKCTQLEKIDFSIHQDEAGAYQTNSSKVSGEITISGRLTKADSERWREFQKQYGKANVRNSNVALGFLALRAGRGVELLDPHRWTWNGGVCMLQEKLDVLENGLQSESPNTVLEYSWPYQAATHTNAEVSPEGPSLQVTAGFEARGGRRRVNLCLQLDPSLAHRLERVEYLNLHLNPAWGAVQEAQPKIGVAPISRGPDGVEVNVHRWKRPTLGKGNPRRLDFTVEFENPLSDQDWFEGDFQLILKGRLSDLDIVGWYNALGYPTPSQTVSKITQINGSFRFAIATFSYPEEVNEKAKVQKAGPIPDYRLTAALAGALASEGYYVKQIEENPPRVSRAHAYVYQRSWDVKGRRYWGLQPVDFHLVIAGEEDYQGGNVPVWGNTQVEIAVQGNASNAALTQRVQATAVQIEDIVREELTQQTIDVSPPLITDVSDLVVGADDIGQANVVEGQAHYVDSDEVDTHTEMGEVDPATAKRRLAQIEQLLAEHKITVEQYLGLREKYQRLADDLTHTGGKE